MKKPDTIRELERLFNLELHPFTGELEELMRYRYQNHYAVDAEGKLIGLNLRSNKLSDAQFRELLTITTLRALNLSENDLSEIALPESWMRLRFLDLSENKNLSTLELPRAHDYLEWLDLNECVLTRLKVPYYLSLKKLDVSRNGQLSELSFWADCPALVMLDASDNQLTSFDLPVGFGSLKYLYLNGNQLERIRFQHDLPSLEILHLRNNKLEDIPFTLTASPRLQALYLHGNPLRRFPEGTVSNEEDASSWETVRGYLLSLETDQVLHNDEVKLVLLGNSTAGKSSLLRYLEEGEYDEELGSTHGLLNCLWQPVGKDFKVNVWDFGGQEYYHATHRLFLSNNAVSLVLFEQATNRPGLQDTKIKVYENGVLTPKELPLEHFHYAYWLDNLAYFCRGEKPVCLLVQSKMDLPGTQPERVPEHDKETYGLPDDTPRISVKAAHAGQRTFVRHFEDFQDNLITLLDRTKSRYEISARWIDIKTQIRRLAAQKPMISYEEYVDLCEFLRPGIGHKDPGASASMLDALTAYLRETGVILFYPDIEALADTVYIAPKAVAEGIYKVLDYSVIQKEGRFTRQQAEARAGKFGAEQMLALMTKFQLIFEVKDGSGEYVAPQYLPAVKPTDKSFVKLEERCSHMAFALYFPRFLPKSVISRFICEYGRLSRDVYWKNGIQFSTTDNVDVLVESDGQGLISVKTSHAQPSGIDRWFRTFRGIVRDHPDVQVSVNGTDFVALTVLLNHPHVNPLIQSVPPHAKDLDFEPFKPLLEEHHDQQKEQKVKKKKIFISYAHKDDREYYEQFVDKIRSHKHRDWDVFTDQDILLGENWEERLTNEARQCELAILLVSANFFNSDFIREKEFGEFIRRSGSEGFRFFSLLLSNCIFDQWPELAKIQMFMPLGKDYGFENTSWAEREISFAMLVDKGHSHREHLNNYCLDFCRKVEKALNSQAV